MSSNEIYRVKCPFCSVQDNILLERGDPENAVFGKENLFELYYDKESDRGLCPRGNFALELLNSPYRLRRVMGDGKPVEFNDAIEKCSSKLKEISSERNSIGILIGGNHTLEEAYMAKELAKYLNTELIGLFPFEDEALLSVKNDFSFTEIPLADLIFVVGDIFSHSPTMAKLILDARNRERGNRLVYLDIIGGRVKDFSLNYYPRPGYMAYFLSLLSDYIDGKKVDLEKTGIGLSTHSLEEIASFLKDSKNGWILFSNAYGHFRNPLSIVRELENISHQTDNHFAVIPVAQNSLGVGRVIGKFNNKRIVNRLKDKEIKALLTFGGSPYELIPEFNNYVDNLEFILSTSFFKEDDANGYIFPASLSIEKEGSIISLEEEIVSLGNPVPPIGGAQSDGVLITHLIKGITGEDIKVKVVDIKPVESKSDESPKGPSGQEDKEFPFILVGAELPYHHGNGEITRRMNWNIEKGEARLLLNRQQFLQLGLKKKVKVVTPYSSSEFEIRDLSTTPFDIPDNVLVVPMHYPESRKLFPLEPDEDGILSPGVVKARLEQ